jgi:hypothetical protein
MTNDKITFIVNRSGQRPLILQRGVCYVFILLMSFITLNLLPYLQFSGKPCIVLRNVLKPTYLLSHSSIHP